MPKSGLAWVRLAAVGALGMGDAGAGGHPVDVAGHDRLVGAEAVAVQDLALEQVGDGGEADMRVRAHVEAASGEELAGAHLVEEDERADHLALARRQGAADLEAAEVVRARQQDEFDRAWQGVARCVFGRLRTHAPLPFPHTARFSEPPSPNPLPPAGEGFCELLLGRLGFWGVWGYR